MLIERRINAAAWTALFVSASGALVSPHIFAAAPMLMIIVNCVAVVALAMIVAGAYIVWRGAQGATSIRLLGGDISAQNVGVAGIACGLLLLVFVLRPLIESVVELGRI